MGSPRELTKIEHGTVAGYKKHRYRKEEACPACLTAWRVYYRKRKAAKRKEKAIRKVEEQRAALD